MMSQQRLFAIVVVFFIPEVTGAVKGYVPRRCCSPDQFTASLKSTMTTYRHYTEQLQPKVTFTYDYINRRWGYYEEDPYNSTIFTRVAFDYNKNVKILETEQRCFVSPNDGTPMRRHCVTANASYDGTYTYGRGDHSLSVYQWSYEYGIVPIRSVRLVTKENCYPVTDMAGIVVKNTWTRVTGDPPCNPWQDPKRLLKGKCYKSFKKREIKESVIEFSVPLVTAEYRDIALTVTNKDIFNIPAYCQQIPPDDWGDEQRLDDLFRIMLYWFNSDEPIIN